MCLANLHESLPDEFGKRRHEAFSNRGMPNEARQITQTIKPQRKHASAIGFSTQVHVKRLRIERHVCPIRMIVGVQTNVTSIPPSQSLHGAPSTSVA
jgi:hypothetical protein